MGPQETALRLVSEAYCPPPDSPMNGASRRAAPPPPLPSSAPDSCFPHVPFPSFPLLPRRRPSPLPAPKSPPFSQSIPFRSSPLASPPLSSLPLRPPPLPSLPLRPPPLPSLPLRPPPLPSLPLRPPPLPSPPRLPEFLCLSHVAGDPLVGQAVSGPPPKLTVLLVGDDSTAKRSFLEWYTGESIPAATSTKLATTSTTNTTTSTGTSGTSTIGTTSSSTEPAIRVVTSGSWKDTLTGEAAASAAPGVARALDHMLAARDLLSVHVYISKDRSLPCIDFVDLPLPSLPQSAASPIPPLSSASSSAPASAASAPPAAATAAAALSEATAALGAAADVIVVFMSVATVRAPSSRLANQLSFLLSPSNTQHQQQQLTEGNPRLDRVHFVALLPQSKASTAAAGTAATVVDYLRSNVKELHSLSADQVTLLRPPSSSSPALASTAAAAPGAEGKEAGKEAGKVEGKEAGPETFSFVEEILDKAVKAAVEQRVDRFERDVRRVKAVIDSKLQEFQQEQGEQRQRSKQAQRLQDTASSLLLPLLAFLIPLALSLIISPPPLLRHLANIAAAKAPHPSSWEFPPYVPPQIASTITTAASLLIAEAHRFAETAAAVASSVTLPPSLAPAADMRIQLVVIALLVFAYLALRTFATVLDRAPPSAAASDRSKLRVFQAFCDMALTFCGARRPAM
ncbi:unnamed protein product [Closterium sp. Naga37s-1]|nr:unnamed protein product [Closterium sp. Naga37s-1]